MEEGNEEHGARNATIGEKGSWFQLSSEADGSLGEGKLQKTVRMLAESNLKANNLAGNNCTTLDFGGDLLPWPR